MGPACEQTRDRDGPFTVEFKRAVLLVPYERPPCDVPAANAHQSHDDEEGRSSTAPLDSGCFCFFYCTICSVDLARPPYGRQCSLTALPDQWLHRIVSKRVLQIWDVIIAVVPGRCCCLRERVAMNRRT